MKKMASLIALSLAFQFVFAQNSVTAFADINGARINYETAGSGDAVIFIHGMSLDSRIWEKQWKVFSASFRVIRYDVRGFGQSSRVNATHNPGEDLKALMDFLKIEKATLVGHSMGGNIALNFSIKYPERVKKIISVDAIIDGFTNRTPELNQIFKEVIDTTREKGWQEAKKIWLRSPLFKLYLADKSSRTLIEKIVSEYHGDHFSNRGWTPTYGEPYTATSLAQIKVPVLIITGEKDERTLLLVADLLHDKIATNKKIVFNGAGHFPNLDKPGEFNKACISFIRE
jgi:3-oxoadipate enol-lactonase